MCAGQAAAPVNFQARLASADDNSFTPPQLRPGAAAVIVPVSLSDPKIGTLTPGQLTFVPGSGTQSFSFQATAPGTALLTLGVPAGFADPSPSARQQLLNVIPVNQEGVDRSAIKAVIRVLQAGNGVLVFPEGSRTIDGNLQAAEPGLGLIIAKTLAPVVPMRIFGARDALPRGGGRLRLVPIMIVIGEPILFGAADLEPSGKNVYAELSDRVMKAISALRLE